MLYYDPNSSTLDTEEFVSIDNPLLTLQFHMCLMANRLKVSSTLNPNTYPNDECDDEEDDNKAFLYEMEIVYASLRGNANARFKVEHFMKPYLNTKRPLRI
jgi:hypothetical protein